MGFGFSDERLCGGSHKRPFPGEKRRHRRASSTTGGSYSQNSFLKPSLEEVWLHTSFRRDWAAAKTGQGEEHDLLAIYSALPRRCEDGQPAAAYTWHVASGVVLVVVDLDLDGWRSVTHDAVGIVAEPAEPRPDLAYGSLP
jgi:hypothetical protein